MAYARTQDEKIRKYLHEPLKACTVHVRGVLPQDRRGDMLKNLMEDLIAPQGGSVLQVTIVPDFQTLF